MVEQPRHHDVAALDQPHLRWAVGAHDVAQDIGDPGAGGVDQHAGRQGRQRRRRRVSSVSVQASPWRSAAMQRVRGWMLAPRARASMALSTTRRASSTQQSEYSKAVVELGLQRPAGRVAAQIEAAGRRQGAAAAEMVVEEQPEAQQPGRPQPGVMRQHEAQRPDDVRRRTQQHLALDQRLADQPELVVFEIAQAAMDQLGRG